MENTFLSLLVQFCFVSRWIQMYSLMEVSPFLQSRHTVGRLRAPTQHLPAALRFLLLLLFVLSTVIPTGLQSLFILLFLSPSHSCPGPFGPWHGWEPRHPFGPHRGNLASCLINGPIARIESLTDPSLLVFLQITTLPTALTYFSGVLEGEEYFFGMSLNCQISICNSSCCLSFSSSREYITSASVAEYHSSDQLAFRMLLFSSEPPHLPLKLLLHLRSVHWWKTSGGAKMLEAAKMKLLLFTQQNELPCGGGMVHSCQATLPLQSKRRESENKHRRRGR